MGWEWNRVITGNEVPQIRRATSQFYFEHALVNNGFTQCATSPVPFQVHTDFAGAVFKIAVDAGVIVHVTVTEHPLVIDTTASQGIKAKACHLLGHRPENLVGQPQQSV
jgi:hypothetical protein